MVTDKLSSYGAALKELGAETKQVTERRETNRAETSHRPFRRRERAMLRFRRMHSLQTSASGHGSVHTHVSADRTLTSRDHDEATHSAALAWWQTLQAG
jgi:putative transposase